MLHPERRKGNLKKIAYDELREELGFNEKCENCKQNTRACQYDSHFSLMDFCERLDMAIESILARDEHT